MYPQHCFQNKSEMMSEIMAVGEGVVFHFILFYKGGLCIFKKEHLTLMTFDFRPPLIMNWVNSPYDIAF